MGYRKYQAVDDAFYKAITDKAHPPTAGTIRTLLELPDAEDAPNPNLVRNKMTPAMILANQGNDDALQELVAAIRSIGDVAITTDVTYTNDDGVTALHLLAKAPVASIDDRFMTVQRFAEHKADINARSAKHPQTPLIEAAEAGMTTNVDALLAYKADPTITANGFTARQRAQEMLATLHKARAPDAEKIKAYTGIVDTLKHAEERWTQAHPAVVPTTEGLMRAAEQYLSLLPTISDALIPPILRRPKGPSR